MNKSHKTCFFLDINLDKTEEIFITNILACILNFVFSLINCVGNLFILVAILKNPRSPFAIVHSFGLSGGFRSSCWPNMSTILRGVQNSRTCGEFQRLLYAKNVSVNIKLDNFRFISTYFGRSVH